MMVSKNIKLKRASVPDAGVGMISTLVSDMVIDAAYHWLCKARLKYSAHSDVWDLRFNWSRMKPIIQEQLLAGTYTLSPMIRVEIDGEIKTFWGAADVLVLKAISLVLGDALAPTFRNTAGI